MKNEKRLFNLQTIFQRKSIKYLFIAILISLFLFNIITGIGRHTFSTNFIILVGLVIINLSLYYYFSKFDYTIAKKKKIIGIIISFLASITLVLIFKSFFLYNYKDTTITLKKQVNNMQELGFIDNFIINNVKYSYDGNSYINTFTYDLCDAVDFDFSKTDTEIKIKKSKDIKITFKTDENIEIIDNNKSQIINSHGSNEYLYSVIGNRYISYKSIINTVLAIIMFSYYLYILYKFLINDKNNKKEKILVITLLTVMLIGLLYYNNFTRNCLYIDSTSYIKFDFHSFLHLKFSGRTPVYPTIIRINNIIFGNEYLSAVCILQYIIWFISICYLYKTILLFTKKDKLAYIASIIYAISPTIVAWNNIILTESLALSGTLVFIYYILKYIKENKISDAIKASILSLILTFHRPTSLIYVMFLIIFFIIKLIFDNKNRKKDLKGLIISSANLVIIIIYTIIFHRTYKFYSISDAVPRQTLFVTIQEGYYKDGNNEAIIKTIDDSLEKTSNDIWSTLREVLSNYELHEIRDFANYARKKNMKKYVQHIIDLTFQHIPIKFEGYSFLPINYTKILKYFPDLFSVINFGHVYIVMTINLILTILSWIKNKKVPFIYGGLSAFPLVIIFSSFIGTCAEFMRTAICCIPFVYISIFFFLNELNKNSEKK